MSDLTGWGVLSDGTRVMLERIGKLATEDAFQAEEAAAEAALRAEAQAATTEPTIYLPFDLDEPEAVRGPGPLTPEPSPFPPYASPVPPRPPS